MQKITAHHLLLLWNSYAPPFERISGMPVWKAGSVFSGETLRSQVFFYYGSWPTKALGPSDVWKTICSLSQSVQASLLVILPRRLWSRNGCGVSRRKRAAASNSCSIFISVCCCLVKVEGDRETITKNITQTPPSQPCHVPQRLCVTHRGPSLFVWCLWQKSWPLTFQLRMSHRQHTESRGFPTLCSIHSNG